MSSNTFLTPGTTTELTFLYDTPKEGVSKFGPYRAYRVRTSDGNEHTFFPPRSLFPELDRLNVRRGTTVQVRTTERISPDGRVVPKLELEETVQPSSPATGSVLPASSGPQSSILACVALKAAAGCGGADEE
ncbi:MAG: hypothetical protein ABIT01_06690, partial [Thermoanaerobaculia bacterium]